ncbi:MAG: 30S ribosomal protein S4 [Deltaproteobacteria bacterium]|nr:30S ribosomal protein S4 [Deltaproteobacteria bacterium]
MSRYLGPRIRLMRAVGMNLPGLSRKTIERKPFPPGMREGQFKKKKSEYGVQLMEKQKLRFNYGLTERYFRRLMAEAFKSREHSGNKLLELLERRLDNVVFRAGLAPTIAAARQLVNHKHVLIDGKKINIPSYTVDPGQVISLTPKGYKNPTVVYAMENPSLARPAWLSYDESSQSVKMITVPDRESFPFAIDIHLVIEYYARRVSR